MYSICLVGLQAFSLESQAELLGKTLHPDEMAENIKCALREGGLK